MTDLPARIRAYRTEKGLSATAFGRLVQSDRQNVYNWEAGRTTPSPKVLYRLSDDDVAILSTDERDALIRGAAA